MGIEAQAKAYKELFYKSRLTSEQVRHREEKGRGNMGMDAMLYYYKAIITEIYDGDTVTADIDLGCKIWLRGEKLRLYGINAPEMRGPEKEKGIVTRDWLRDIIWGDMEGRGHVLIETKKDKQGKYGRLLATIYKYDEETHEWIDLNRTMVQLGLAEAKEY